MKNQQEATTLVEEGNQEYEVVVSLNGIYETHNKYYFATKLMDFIYPLSTCIGQLVLCSMLGGICSFAFLIYSAGWRKGEETVVLKGMVKMPLDLYLALHFILAMSFLALVSNMYYYSSDIIWGITVCFASIAAIAWAVVICMNVAVRIKVGAIWKNTVIFRVIYMVIKWSKKSCRMIKNTMQRIPLVWKSFLCCGGISFFLIMGGTVIDESFPRLLFLCFCCAFICCYILYIMALLKEFKIASEILAEGNLSYQVQIKKMPREFQEAAENLNTLAQGLTKAVDEKIKSERMKTELITNVSHDIKTPLTSIINYADLIREEQTSNVKIKEYSDILFRHSNRLKKLIEDLVEVSKASTGNMEILLEPCEIGVLLFQTVGEYEQKLAESKLQVIVKQPEKSVKIMADGRRLWRVFDNLFNNVCKYAQEGTRVYFSLQESRGEAIISLKNISKYPLDITEEELMERFVRGDNSRQSEGNGLGLSIAESLTSLQGGSLSLTIDGDLFKVVLVFDCIEN